MVSVYEGVLEPSYKKSTKADAARSGHSRENRGESTSSYTYSEMIESPGKCRKIYVDNPKGESKNLSHTWPRAFIKFMQVPGIL